MGTASQRLTTIVIINIIPSDVSIVGGGVMQWFKGRYVQSLEAELCRLRNEVSAIRKYNDQLIERLLRKGGIPSIELPPEPSKEALETMLQSGAGGIFDDLDEPKGDDLVDNRTEKFDEFVS